MSVRHALLALLSQGPKYGLQLRQEFEAGTGEVWPLNVGQVYTTLQRLERDGFVESDDGEAEEGGPQKRFRITVEGEEELDDWLRTPPNLSSPPRDELVMKVLVSLRVPGVDVHDVIQVHRRHLVELMQQWTRIKEDSDGDVALALALDATATSSWVMARWTCPMDAAAIGTGSHSAKTWPGGAPSSARTTSAAKSADIGGASCCSSASDWRTGSGTLSST